MTETETLRALHQELGRLEAARIDAEKRGDWDEWRRLDRAMDTHAMAMLKAVMPDGDRAP